MFLGPLYLYSLAFARTQYRLAGIVVLAGTLLAWFCANDPRLSGGTEAYFGALAALRRLVPSTGTVFNSSPATSIARVCVLVFVVLLSCGSASLPLLRACRPNAFPDPIKIRFTMVWIVPALFFNHSYLPPVCKQQVCAASLRPCVRMAWAVGIPMAQGMHVEQVVKVALLGYALP